MPRAPIFSLSLNVNKLQSAVKDGLQSHWVDRASYSSVADVTNMQTDSPYWSKWFAETPFESICFSARHFDMNDKTKPGMQMHKRKLFLCCKSTFPLSKSWVNVAQLITAQKRRASRSADAEQEGKSNSTDLKQQLTALYNPCLFSPCARIALTPFSITWILGNLYANDDSGIQQPPCPWFTFWHSIFLV